MFCKKCGKYNPDNARACKYCGCPELTKNSHEAPTPSYQTYESKTVIGVVMAIFLGLIGLIIGLLIYPSGSYERETFLSGWLKTFIIAIIIEVVLIICLTSCATCALALY